MEVRSALMNDLRISIMFMYCIHNAEVRLDSASIVALLRTRSLIASNTPEAQTSSVVFSLPNRSVSNSSSSFVILCCAAIKIKCMILVVLLTDLSLNN